jgi:Cu/Ag efflux pump CusA
LGIWHLARLCLRLGPVVGLGFVLLIGGGIWAFTELEPDLLPGGVSLANVEVIVRDAGALPDVVDQKIIVPLSNALHGFTGADANSGASDR